IPPEGDIFLAGTDGVNRSTDDGLTWYYSNNGIPYEAARFVYTLAMDSNGTIYAGSGGGVGVTGVYRSTDNGQTWGQWNNGLPNNWSVLALTMNSRRYLFAGTA